MKQAPFVIERSYNAPVEKLWKALTDKEQMKQWYFDVSDFKLEVGFEFTFAGENEGKKFIHLCKITEAVPNKKLSYSWRYEGYEGISYVTFELYPENEGTRLKLTHEGLETFPPLNDFKKENFAEGWTYITGISLKDFLEKTKVRKAIEISSSTTKVWDVLVQPSFTREWASQFSEGAYVETDWQKDSDVVWKDREGNIGAKGKVIINEAPHQLKVLFYDDPNADTHSLLGTYAESYTVTENNGKVVLSIEAGPLAYKEAESLSPLWDKGITKMKELAEA
jgi:uncharacterized protein YndB with AHSA1/START domain